VSHRTPIEGASSSSTGLGVACKTWVRLSRVTAKSTGYPNADRLFEMSFAEMTWPQACEPPGSAGLWPAAGGDSFVSKSTTSTYAPRSETYREEDGPPTSRWAIAFSASIQRVCEPRPMPRGRTLGRAPPPHAPFWPPISLFRPKVSVPLGQPPSASKATQVVDAKTSATNVHFEPAPGSKRHGSSCKCNGKPLDQGRDVTPRPRCASSAAFIV